MQTFLKQKRSFRTLTFSVLDAAAPKVDDPRVNERLTLTFSELVAETADDCKSANVPLSHG